MAKIKKKGTSGAAKNYITRTQAVRKLQVSLPDFRRLCIFKGIYPREPRSKKKASKTSTPSTTFYYTRDIQYLLHEPLLCKFREQKSLSKKIAKSLGRGDVRDAARIEKNNTPKISLDHIIKERYPTFIDALRDLDDALSLLFLFANLPSTTNVPPKTIALCQRLCHEFQHYLITSHSLRKSFLSIKGIYYQATIQGQDILWLVPYRFVQKVSGDIDYRIMATFVDFYTTLLGFVNFRLYTSIGLVYPPKFDARSDEHGAELAAFTLEGRKIGDQLKAIEPDIQTNGTSLQDNPTLNDIQSKVNTILQNTNLDDKRDTEIVEQKQTELDAFDRFEITAPEADSLPQPQKSGNESGSLFTPLTFFISREAPRAPLEFLLRAFGCKRIGWDAVLGEGAFTHDERDPRITHQIVDRPPLAESSLPPLPQNPENGTEATIRVRPGTKIPGRTYVQPQWVWDCVNDGKILRPDIYAPGATLPPHLSPWVKPSKGEYDPRLSLAEQEDEGEDRRAAEDDQDEEESEDQDVKSIVTKGAQSQSVDGSEEGSIDGGMEIDIPGSDDEEDEEEEEEEDTFENSGDIDGMVSDQSASEDEDEVARNQHQKELEAEAAGLPFAGAHEVDETSSKLPKKKPLNQKHAIKKKKEEEELERQKMMMSRKKRKLLDKMLYSNKKKDEQSEKLRRKRRKIEQGKKE
ncbi:mRNA-binding ribosome synthesis protein nop7 [Ophidiomyces ophidiicola]|nr:mRNA-binding ribosome synthesis protein nop7 [Ophidiomyces ophidiicola]